MDPIPDRPYEGLCPQPQLLHHRGRMAGRLSRNRFRQGFPLAMELCREMRAWEEKEESLPHRTVKQGPAHRRSPVSLCPRRSSL